MDKKRSYFLSILVGFLLWFAYCSPRDNLGIQIKDGVLEAGLWNPEQNTLSLNGEWELYPNAFLVSEHAKIQSPPILTEVPDTWNRLQKDGKTIFPSGRGYGTYRLRLNLPTPQPALVMRIPDQGTAYVLYADRKPIASMGKIGKNYESSIPFLSSTIVNLPENTRELVFEISNYRHIYGGLWYPPRIGKQEKILNEKYIDLALEIATSSSVLVLVIYQIVAYLLIRKERAPLHFAIFSVAGTLRFFLTGDRIFNSIFPEIPWEITHRLEYLSTYALASAFFSYAASLFPLDFPKWSERAAFTSLSFFAIVTIFFPVDYYGRLLIPFQSIVVIGSCLILYGCVKALIHKREGAWLFLIGIFTILLASTNDILASHYLLHTQYILAPAIFIFIFLNSLTLAVSFSKTLEKSQIVSAKLTSTNKDLNDLKIQLERKVETRTKELMEAKNRAEGEAKYRYDFLATMSHEVRTPLNGLMGTANLLSETPLNLEQKEYLDIIQLSSENLLQLVNQLLDLSKIESNRFELEVMPFDPFAILQKAAKVVKARAEEKRIFLDIHYPEHHPGIYVGDEGRIQQVLLNLLSNAIKFTGSGGKIVLGVKTAGEDSQSRILEFWVEDTGVGIAPEKATDLFEPFVQADSSVFRNYGGSGLGLTISKKLVELMGGSIRVVSQIGKGSKFIFLLPFPQEESDAPESTEEKSPYLSFIPKKILLVEDREPSRTIAKKTLENMNMKVSVACDGKDALFRLTNEIYDLALIDIEMPELSGIEVVRSLKEQGGKLPILVAWTAHALPGAEAVFQSTGFDAYLHKPSLRRDWERLLKTYFPQ
ncbi:GHKL domain protein [Leptospira broomii serovar Hurstbridge str. 5399]|uniref:histidine kinase n=1 Tax=Leptospira broomii serovar Hurstbridge str. 5399 TaxID=1049789 RepID=T0F3K3_9LEPT|nr:ATP-binding protein [Leptospira broomii]EQA45675.1 GHKL domain protein [Leptospira broomii serovar Hurstbridge str. 5399]